VRQSDVQAGVTRPARLAARARCAALATLVARASAAVAAPAPTAEPQPGVVLVLAGGGARGFAHLAVLRRLERDGVPIARIVGSSMGAVIGGLYASGSSVEQIERLIGERDPARVALDQLERTELPPRERAYQGQFPIGIEFGVRGGQLGFARGASDGQRLLDLLQRRTSHVPPGAHFDQLRIPFRAVATRYRDGAMHVFDRGALHLAMRASLAAPGVFAPVEIGGETYVDGGLVANVPVEVALAEGAQVLVVSHLGQAEGEVPDPRSALAVATRMLDILILQNERRSLALLRPQDLLVRPALAEFGFADFARAAEIVARGDEAVRAQEAQFAALAALFGRGPAAGAGSAAQAAAPAGDLPATTPAGPGAAAAPPAVTQARVTRVRAQGQRDVPAAYIERRFADLLGRPFDAHLVSERVDALYAQGHFERVAYELQPLQPPDHELRVTVQEKAYGPHRMRPSLSLYSDNDGNHLYALGVGYRRAFVTERGLELLAEARLGSQSELAGRAQWPLGARLQLGSELRFGLTMQPLYFDDRKVATARISNHTLVLDLNSEVGEHGLARVGLVGNRLKLRLDTGNLLPLRVNDEIAVLVVDPVVFSYTALRMQWLTDRLDSATFPTSGHLASTVAEFGAAGASYASRQVNLRWAGRRDDHVLQLGLNVGRDDVPGCAQVSCPTPNLQVLGGFQAMGAYRAGQLAGDRLVHLFVTYMHRLSDGGLWRQPVYAGVVGEVGDAWSSPERFRARYSATAFVGMDSRIGDIYFALARGSRGQGNVFLQIGRRFTVW